MAGLGEALLELQELTRRLRRDCPWDREQTARTIVPHTVEEAYEVADAALTGNDAKLLDELGDLLFQVYFLALLLEERGNGDLEQATWLIHDFEYPDVRGALADLDDELRELKEAIDAAGGEPPPETEPDPRVFEELGDVLFAAVNVARRVNVDPELALRAMSQRFRDRVERAEQRAAAAGETFAELSLEQKDAYFDQAKEEFR